VNPNNKFEIYVDQTLVNSGSLLEDMTSVLLTVYNPSVYVCLYNVSQLLCYLCCMSNVLCVQFLCNVMQHVDFTNFSYISV